MKAAKQQDSKIAECVRACPVNLDVPRYIRYIKSGRFSEALAVIRERLPLPTVCSDACFAPCEEACAYRQIGDALAIRALKRAAVDYGDELLKKNIKPADGKGKKVAIVGAGASGLTAAYYLARLGYTVTVYDSMSKPGGTMRYGIPKYRLPEQRLDKDIKEILESGVKFVPDMTLGKQISLTKLEMENDAILLATGATASVKISVEGLNNVESLWAYDFLRDAGLGKKIVFNGDVVVIGGGNVAVDAALTARRDGAGEVSLVCLEKEQEMPAHDWEIARANEEGVKIYAGWGLKRVIANGSPTLEFVKCKSVFDKSGRFSPIFDDSVNLELKTKYIIFAIGQASDLSYVKDSKEIEVARGAIVVNSELATGKPSIFAAGDVVSGPSSVIEAVAQGKRAAESIDRYLGGKGNLYEPSAPDEIALAVNGLACEAKTRIDMPLLPIKDRIAGFSQIEQGFAPEQAKAEAERCLMCDTRHFDVIIYSDNCKECRYCIEACDLHVFEQSKTFNRKGYKYVNSTAPEKCIGCMKCFFACPDFAIDIKRKNVE